MKSPLFYIIVILVFCFVSCGGESQISSKAQTISRNKEAKQSTTKKVNLSVFLDLSDRVNPIKNPNTSMEYFQRDTAYLNILLKSFVTHLESKRVITIDDRFQVYFEPPPADAQINSSSKELKVHFTKDNISNETLKEFRVNSVNNIRLIYENSIRKNMYLGSDIFGFFKNKINQYCIREGYENFLVILTDGYIFHQNNKFREGNKTSYITSKTIQNLELDKKMNWLEIYNQKQCGFIELKKDLSKLNILILGINPDNSNPYELDIINHYWAKWFDSMGVENYIIKGTDLPSNLEDVIYDFII